jgi:2Fe-2S ferredoxin
LKINFKDPAGAVRTVDADAGQSVMQAARAADVGGIVAVCGGNMLCGTCHVSVEDDWIGRAGAPGEDEAAVLEALDARADVGPNSRLACQIKMTPELDGITVRLPRYQPGV